MSKQPDESLRMLGSPTANARERKKLEDRIAAGDPEAQALLDRLNELFPPALDAYKKVY